MADVHEQYKQELIAEVETAVTLLVRMDPLMTEFEERKNDVLTQQDKLEEQTNGMVHRLQQTLEAKRSALIDQLQEVTAKKVASLRERMGEVNRYEVELRNCIQEANSLLEDPNRECTPIRQLQDKKQEDDQERPEKIHFCKS